MYQFCVLLYISDNNCFVLKALKTRFFFYFFPMIVGISLLTKSQSNQVILKSTYKLCLYMVNALITSLTPHHTRLYNDGMHSFQWKTWCIFWLHHKKDTAFFLIEKRVPNCVHNYIPPIKLGVKPYLRKTLKTYLYVHSSACRPRSIAAFSAGRPNASHPIGCKTCSNWMVKIIISKIQMAVLGGNLRTLHKGLSLCYQISETLSPDVIRLWHMTPPHIHASQIREFGINCSDLRGYFPRLILWLFMHFFSKITTHRWQVR